MQKEIAQNALKSIAKQCNIQLSKHKGNTELMRPISDKFAEQARLIGFNRSQLLYEIGLINKVLTER